jgi:SAM-dependent methyltransferase
MKLNMCDMPEIRDASLDFVIACDVLEHVPDDGQALAELSRVLRPGGWAVLTVPQKDGLATTYEDASITSEEGRLQAFGQEDHLRIYGDDFPELVGQHGFDVTSVDEKSFPQALVSKHVLFPPVLSSHPLATNYRKVFFAQKRAT